MKIEVDLNQGDYTKYHRFLFFKHRRTFFYYIFILGAFIFLIWPREESSFSRKILEVIIWILIVLVVFGAYLLISRIFRKITKNEYHPVVGKHTFELGVDTIIEENAIGITQAKYSSMKHVAQTKEHIFVMMTNGSAYIIPKRAFQNKVQEAEFITLLKQKIETNKSL